MAWIGRGLGKGENGSRGGNGGGVRVGGGVPTSYVSSYPFSLTYYAAEAPGWYYPSGWRYPPGISYGPQYAAAAPPDEFVWIIALLAAAYVLGGPRR